jgi:hypothetical protein
MEYCKGDVCNINFVWLSEWLVGASDLRISQRKDPPPVPVLCASCGMSHFQTTSIIMEMYSASYEFMGMITRERRRNFSVIIVAMFPLLWCSSFLYFPRLTFCKLRKRLGAGGGVVMVRFREQRCRSLGAGGAVLCTLESLVSCCVGYLYLCWGYLTTHSAGRLASSGWMIIWKKTDAI